ncbi:hypothetical protein DMH04_18065 [Kibdelosporangium aridum]|uniref:Peptidase M50 domain-containing protein n=1 Tax=Kibdelosporangium aridum TaxID=2030 RepID=A0A428ZAW4_KIBAR|nr:site-2 protease family protein [Kibdelosporangium aridum]RSM85205.1 hypothetical protein DMH04_18065 [Kibdelosporangium aridum]
MSTINRVPVYVHWNVLLVPTALIVAMAVTALPASAPGHPTSVYWAAAMLVGVLFVVSLVAHELAHAVAARRQHIQAKDVTLSCFGGTIRFATDTRTPRAEFVISVAGPAANVALGLLSAVVAVVVDMVGAPNIEAVAFAWLAIVNVLLAVLNLLPGAEMDGGQMLMALLWRVTGDRRRAAAAAVRVGRVSGAVLVLASLTMFVATGSYTGLWLLLSGLLIISQSHDRHRASAGK